VIARDPVIGKSSNCGLPDYAYQERAGIWKSVESLRSRPKANGQEPGYWLSAPSQATKVPGKGFHS
jgi:hypothetical protein